MSDKEERYHLVVVWKDPAQIAFKVPASASTDNLSPPAPGPLDPWCALSEAMVPRGCPQPATNKVAVPWGHRALVSAPPIMLSVNCMPEALLTLSSFLLSIQGLGPASCLCAPSTFISHIIPAGNTATIWSHCGLCFWWGHVGRSRTRNAP